jgi:hypothetical protein
MSRSNEHDADPCDWDRDEWFDAIDRQSINPKINDPRVHRSLELGVQARAVGVVERVSKGLVKSCVRSRVDRGPRRNLRDRSASVASRLHLPNEVATPNST